MYCAVGTKYGFQSVDLILGGNISEVDSLQNLQRQGDGNEPRTLKILVDTPRFKFEDHALEAVSVTPVEYARGSPPVIRVVQNWYEEFRDRE